MEITNSSKKTVILPSILKENSKGRENRADIKEKSNAREVLTRRINVTKK